MPGLTGPFEIGAPDGQVYFTLLEPPPALIRGYENLLNAREVAVAKIPGLEGRARGLAIDLLLQETQAAINRVGALTAARAEEEIVRRIDLTQIRPDPGGERLNPGARLRDAILCRPIPTFPAGGMVGVADVIVLDQVIGRDSRPYWWQQEFGSTHNVGRRIRGVFMPGRVAADKFQSRVHPVFRTEQGGPEMFIENPIPERAFLREGAYAAALFRHQRFQAVQADAIAEMRLIETGNHPRLQATRRFSRGRLPPL